MSREFKFRAWHKIEKRFVCLRGINFVDDCISYDCQGECNYNDIADFDDVSLQQYIGLKDKNGVEIYEGDIIRFENQEGVWADQSNKNNEVKYPFVCGNAHLSEVIGNIFENPEILE